VEDKHCACSKAVVHGRLLNEICSRLGNIFGAANKVHSCSFPNPTPQGTELFLPGDKYGHFEVTMQLKSS
jgi:hypothetical protein